MRRASLLAMLTAPALAQQVLYQPLPPAGSAHLRIANGTGEPLLVGALTPGPLTPGTLTLGTGTAQRISPYAVQLEVAGRPIALALSAGAARGEASLPLQPGSFNTLVVLADGAALRAVPLVDETQFNQTRARLTFYNATANCAGGGLALDPAGQVVFADVAPGAARMRSVNPVSAQVRVGCDAARGPAFALGGLEAGGQYSIWLMSPAGQPIGFVTRDTTAPWTR